MVDLTQPRPEIGSALGGRALLLQVGTRGEAAAGGRDQHGPGRVVGGHGAHGIEQVLAELLVPRIERLGTVEQDPRRGAVPGHVDGLVRGHAGTLFSGRSPDPADYESTLAE